MYRTHDYPLLVYLQGIRAEYRAQGQGVEFLPFAYNADFLPINTLTTGNAVNTTDEDADFHVLSMQQACFDSATGAFVQFPNATVRITSGVSGQRFEDRDTHLLCLFGTAMRPFWPIRPPMFPSKTSWTTTVTNQDTINYNLRLCYWGVKAVPKPLR